MLLIMDAMSLAIRMKEAREAAGLTQQQLADACGLSPQSVSAWERGRAESLLAEHLFKIADKLQVNPRWLATGEAENLGPQTALSEILRGLESMTADQQEAVRVLVRSMSK